MGKEEYFPRGGSGSNSSDKLSINFNITVNHHDTNGTDGSKKGLKRQSGSTGKEFVKKPKIGNSSNGDMTEDNLLGDELLFVSSRKKMKQNKKNRVTGEDISHLTMERKQQDKDFLVDTLTYESMCEGILSLGKVIKVNDHEILVSLPGRTLGSVPITCISSQYTKCLEKMAAGQLGEDEKIYGVSEMFKPGQVVVVKVTSVVRTDSKCRVSLSMRPEDVHSNYSSLLFNERMVCMAAVESHEDHGYVMSVGVKSVRAFLPISGAKAYMKSQNNGKSLGIGQLVPCKITTVKFHRLVANVTLTAEPKEVRLRGMTEGLVNYSTLLPGMLVKSTVLNVHKTGLKVYFLDIGGMIHQDHMQDMWFNPKNAELGSEVSCRVLYVMPNGTRPYLSLQAKLMPGSVSEPSSSVKLGGLYKVTIVRYEKRGLIIRFSTNEKGIVTPQRCSDDLGYLEENLIADFPAGSSHDCRVIAYSAMDNVYIASFQQSILKQNYIHIEQLSLGEIVECQLHQWNSGGAVVNIGRVKGFIPLTHFGVIPCKDPRIRYTVGLKFKARIFKLDVPNSKVLLTARKPLLKSQGPLIARYEDANPGQISDGVIHKIQKAGLLVTTMGGLMGFIPASKVSKEPLRSFADHFALGQVVKFKVLEVKVNAKKLILTLDFENEVEMENESNDVEMTNGQNEVKAKKKKNKLKGKHEESNEVKTKKEEKKVKAKKKKNKVKTKNESNEVDVKNEPESEPEDLKPLTLESPSSSFWDISGLMKVEDKEESGSSESDEESHEIPSSTTSEKKKKVSKRTQEKLKESALRSAELALADPDRKPQSIEQFDCLVMGSPNSSLCWIQYMSFYLDSANIDMARSIGERALKTIVFNEDQERLNVWVALLNLEDTYGTEESVKNVFKNALKNCDVYKISIQMADIYTSSKKIYEAEKILTHMLKSFKNDLDVWVRLGKLYYRNDKVGLGRKLFNNALAALDKPNHFKVVTKFANLEFAHGDAGKARTLLDKTLAAYPKRLDLYLAFAKIHIKHKSYDTARLVYELAAGIGFPPKKARTLFKQYLEFENEHGDASTRATVGKLAVEYVQNIDLVL